MSIHTNWPESIKWNIPTSMQFLIIGCFCIKSTQLRSEEKLPVVKTNENEQVNYLRSQVGIFREETQNEPSGQLVESFWKPLVDFAPDESHPTIGNWENAFNKGRNLKHLRFQKINSEDSATEVGNKSSQVPAGSSWQNWSQHQMNAIRWVVFKTKTKRRKKKRRWSSKL